VKFAVKRYWSVCDSVDVEANSVSQAIDIAHELPVDNAKAEYVPDSMNSDPTCDVQALITEKQDASHAQRRTTTP
jgi:hypothetical protein